MYMSPETAMLGLDKFRELSMDNQDCGDSNMYQDISGLNWTRTIYDD